MNITPFDTQIIIDGRYVKVQVHPCCNENNVVDYAIWINNKLGFTITKDEAGSKWVIAMRNADDEIADVTVQQIGMSIDKRNVHL